MSGFIVINEKGFKLLGVVFWDIEKAKTVLDEKMVGKDDGGAFVAVNEKL